MPASVFVYISPSSPPMYAHETATLLTVGRTIARLKQCEFRGLYSGQRRSPGMFFIPDEALVLDEAERLGIRAPTDLFGGGVPHVFVGTKAITHGLVDDNTARPDGWSPSFARKVSHVVLPGYTVFSATDARVAAKHMLGRGTVRLKRPLSCGGGGQRLVADVAEVEAFLEEFSKDELVTHGLVLEMNLDDVTTLSVGKITIDGIVVTYHGVQRVAMDNHGRLVYGGSDLLCLRGDWNTLDRLAMPPEVRLGIAQARQYDEATSDYPRFMSSRRNYDVAQGTDARGRRRSGVLEASWRSGGATTAELAALELFMQDPQLQGVEVSAVKHFGAAHEPPRDAVVHFQDEDPREGPLTRYTMVKRTLRQAA